MDFGGAWERAARWPPAYTDSVRPPSDVRIMTAICRHCGAEFPAERGTHPTCPACGAVNPFPHFKSRRPRPWFQMPVSVRGRLFLAFLGFGTVAVLSAIVVLSRQFR